MKLKEIKNNDLVESCLGRWNPNDIAFITQISFVVKEDMSSSTVTMVCLANRIDLSYAGWPDRNGAWCKIELLFTGVYRLTIKDFGPSYSQISGFDIINIKERNWEGVQYIIEDYENGRIYFECDDIVIISAEKFDFPFEYPDPTF